MLGIYVHLPFCPYICPYCDFAKWPVRASEARRYLDALHAEIEREAPAAAATIFFGGGTPNTYTADDIAGVLERLHRRFDVAADAETTIEVNPELVEASDLRAYRAAGVTRLSIGVQSFDETEIRTLGRRHSATDVAQAVASARAAGIASVSLDLIFAVPGQTPRSWRASLDAAIELGADHISTYGLTVEAGTPYERWQAREPQAFLDDTREAELYGIAIDTLGAAGFEHYEISNFAKPEHRCAHNQNYWENGEYVGLGVGAASYRAGVRSVKTRDLRTYVAALSSGVPAPVEAEQLTGAQRAGEAVMLALRTAQGVSLAQFKERYGLDFLDYYAPVVQRYRDAELLDVDATHARLTRRGRFLANDVCGAFVTFA